MLTQTAERQELHHVVDTLPDDRVIAMLDFAKRLWPHAEDAEWIDPIETGILNAETLEALREIESGDLISFGSKKKLFEFLDSKNAE